MGTPKDYFKSIDEYIWDDYNKRDRKGEWIKDEKGEPIIFHRRLKVHKEAPTLGGLALFLDITVEELLNSEDKEIKMAITKIRKEYEMRLINRGNEGDIFGLKQFIK